MTERYTGRLSKTILPDGSFNVRREGGHWRDAGWFRHFMNLSWPAFLLQTPAIYLGVITLFALAYLAAGVEQLQGAAHSTAWQSWWSAFFFSVQTFTTVGYGHIAPASFLASVIAAVEAMSGILSLAIATGLIYARFSRPNACLAFSANALIAPFQNGQAVMLRVANRRPNVLMDLEAKLLLMTVVEEDGQLKRRFTQLALEREIVYFLPLAWTLVHPIDQYSPLSGKSPEDLARDQAELLVLIKAFDDTFSQTVHARASYSTHDLVWNARFQPAFHIDPNGQLVLHVRDLNAYTRL